MSVDWLDSLSEDWVSEPRSSSPSNIAAGRRSQTHETTRSRIPQYRTSSGAYPSMKSAQNHGMGSTHIRSESVLVERSASRGNIQSPAIADSQQKDSAQRRGLTQRSMSECSQNSVVRHGGTERKATSVSPAKDRGKYETPEWKRRLVQGNIGLDRVDLFSPMGLEKMFQKPPGDTIDKGKKVSRKQSVLKSLEEMPSSPPLWLAKQTGENSEPFTDGTGLDPVRESDAEDSTDGKGMHSSEAGRIPSQAQDDSPKRKTSQQSEVLSDDFSPVFISKHNDGHGRIEYAALDMSKSQLEEELKKLHTSTQTTSEMIPPIHTTVAENDQSTVSDTLPTDLPAGTPDVVPIGEYVSVKRGGRSADGSFRRRPLSPSPLARPPTAQNDESFTVDSTQLRSDIGSDAYIPPPAPTPPVTATPTRPRQGDYLSPTRNQSSLSPLKLFGAHDTFTTNRLQRRMSQMELNDEQGENQHKLSTQREASEEPPHVTEPNSRKTSNTSNFGQGELNEYPFPTEISVLSPSSRQEDEGLVRSRSPSPSMHPPGARDPFKFRVESGSSEMEDTFKNKRKHSKASSRSSLSIAKRSVDNTQKSRKPSQLNIITSFNGSDEPAVPSFVSEGKRPPTTPFKDPTPKRRRTLVCADVEDNITDPPGESIRDSHNRMQSIIGRKRKDARHSNTSNLADPDVLARRHILRPRNPTPSQRRREEIEQEVLEVTEAYLNSSPRLEAIREHLQVPEIIEPGSDLDAAEQEQARAVAEEVAAFSVRIARGMKDDGRKRSVTTQDFLDEAMKIMDFIRTKGRPTSGLGSLEESDESTQQGTNRVMDQDEGSDASLSRPPSQGGRGSKLTRRDTEELDPRVVSHLRQFEDGESEFLASSFQSLHVDHLSAKAPSPTAYVESDPPDIRVFGHAQMPEEKIEAEGSNSKSSSMPSHKSRPSVDSSLGRTTMTTASRRSENVATLAPQAVAHLIPEDVGGMHFDSEKKIWVRVKSLHKTSETVDRDVSGITQSDEDPFGEIPDLTVDELQELERVMTSPSRKPTGMTEVSRKEESSEETVKPPERERKSDETLLSSLESPNVQSTSMAEFKERQEMFSSRNGTVRSKKEGRVSEDTIEHEIKIDEGRSKEQPQNQFRKVSTVEISLSSPFVARLAQAAEANVQRHDDGSNTPQEPHPQHQKTAQAFAKQALQAAEENHEVSIVDFARDSRRVNFSVSVVKPPSGTLAAPPSSPGAPADVTFYLSELSDFTVHQTDEREMQDRSVVHRGPNGLTAIKEDRFEHGNTSLVKALQDIEPDEPFWEDLKRVELSGRNLTSLHLLDVLCDRVETVAVNDNAIVQLVGAPSTVRSLCIRNNLLNSLTAWNHLTNLQYLDISGNDMDNLSGVGCLLHLRELRADNNRIVNLDGVMGLDGLLSLSVRGNRIERVDFENTSLVRLEKLDLASNHLGDSKGLRNLQSLPSLAELNLDNNDLRTFLTPTDINADPCPNLRVISLCNNRFEAVNLPPSFLPSLREVYLDNNRISSLTGLQEQQNLDLLSLRNQHPPLASNLEGIFSHMPDARMLILSGNHIPSFSFTPSRSFLNTTHLELASCGLSSLPEDFGVVMPNLKSLNLNFNNLKDVRPLLGIKRLERLYLSGNRISRLRKLAMVLERLSSSLKEVDLRNNPVTVIPTASAASTSVSIERSTSAHSSTNTQASPYFLPLANLAADTTYAARLDEETKLRRRVYEMLLANGMSGLMTLDGLPFQRKKVLVRDDVWERLVELGVVRKSGKQGRETKAT
ncbi:hypothetical protein NA57DRAFT_45783 [Rhizodiscina lignyota]|uniref:Septation initiation network scaffold protein cdc11 n=1 Tax=Rhizodiscina lignyota TaxID=1504668 RepID=A0A9P4M6B7_9PEZI|nr:hypothetical protein NA57DRAFT_45783 [Rhizodiscina lignyota]